MKKLLIILLLFAVNYSNGQVVLDSVAVTSVFHGTLSKTILEIYVLNTTENDSAESFVNLTINRNSVVENLWLEIDNELKRDTTLSRVAGTTIYNRIVRRRIDPAYLIKYDKGNYHLRIFPINKNQKRKVVIEYYSILGGKKERNQRSTSIRNRTNESMATKETNSLYWFINFQKEPAKKSIKLTSIQPNKTILDLSQIDSTQIVTSEFYDETFIQNYTSKNVNDYKILFNYEKTTSITKYKNDSLVCYSTNRPLETRRNYYRDIQWIDQYKESPPDFVKYLIQNSKEFEDRTLYLNKTRNECNSFLEDILNYITVHKSNEINIELRNFTNQNDFDVWFFDDTTLFAEKLSFFLKPPNESLLQNHVEIECPYVNKFFEYSQVLYTNQTEQITSGYLTETLAKIVIEDDSLTQSIKDDVLEREKLGTLPQSESWEAVFFTAVEKMPEIVGGFDSIYSQIFFPAIADSLLKDERIFIRVAVNKVGKIVCNEVIRSNNEIFSQIGSLAINLVEWLPGEQRGKPIGVQVSIPITFNKDTLGIIPKKNYKIDNRNCIATIESNQLIILEEGFESSEAEDILYRTERFYEFIFNNPEIINFVYKVMYLSEIRKIGLVIKTDDVSKSVIINDTN